MKLTSANSIFRCMPTILPLRFRRLLSAFAYAVDGVELSYSRLRETALDYELPSARSHSPEEKWIARNRLCVLVDAWSMIDHVSRARKLVSQFPWDGAKFSPQLNEFVRETKAAALIRNQLHHVDDDILSGVDVAEGHTILGTVSWVDTRKAGTVVRYAVSSGSSGSPKESPLALPAAGAQGDVSQFCLTVEDQEADIDALHRAITRFSTTLEASLAASVRGAVIDEATKRKVPVEELCESAVADVGIATFKGSDPTDLHAEESLLFAEVKANEYRIGD